MLSKRFSYILLTLFFIFDASASYFAVTRMGGREANLIIAPYVEKYPPLYFLSIPGLIIGLFAVMWLIRKFLKKNETTLEKIILTSFVIYWGVGNSSLNLSFLIGLRHTVFNNWTIMSIVGILSGLLYLSFTLNKLRRK